MLRSLKSSIIADSVGSCQRHANLSIIQRDIRELWYHGSCDMKLTTKGLAILNPIHIFLYDDCVGGSIINFDCS